MMNRDAMQVIYNNSYNTLQMYTNSMLYRVLLTLADLSSSVVGGHSGRQHDVVVALGRVYELTVGHGRQWGQVLYE